MKILMMKMSESRKLAIFKWFIRQCLLCECVLCVCQLKLLRSKRRKKYFVPEKYLNRWAKQSRACCNQHLFVSLRLYLTSLWLLLLLLLLLLVWWCYYRRCLVVSLWQLHCDQWNENIPLMWINVCICLWQANSII